MSAILILAASALAAPEMRAIATEQIFRATPTISRSAGAILVIHIDPRGAVITCSVEEFAGLPEDAEKFCGKLRKVRFKPAVAPDGSPANSRSSVLLSQADGHQSINEEIRRLSMKPDLVRKLTAPGERTSPFSDVGVTLWIAANGSVAECAPSKVSPPQLATAACEQAMPLTFEPDTTFGTPATPYVRSLMIRFERTAD